MNCLCHYARVLQRLATLISRLAVTMANNEAAIKQAKSASDAAAQLLKQEKVEQEEDQQKEANVSNEIKELQEGEKLLLYMDQYDKKQIYFVWLVYKMHS